MHVDKSMSSEHTIEDESDDERKEQNKGDLEDRDLEVEFIIRLESVAGVNALMGKDYVQDRPHREELNTQVKSFKSTTNW